jgi:hypothetical protein
MGCRRQDVRAAFGYNARGDLKKVVWNDETFGMTDALPGANASLPASG